MNKKENSRELKVNSEKYKTCYTNFEGITLVALVITIIVLIILAGVSINAVMNGGLIKNAKDAKNTYEQAKQNEETIISSLEVETDFLTKPTQGYQANVEGINKYSPYKFGNGYLTGINLEYDSTDDIYKTETVQSVIRKLPTGYEILTNDGSDIDAPENTNIVTGMRIEKEGDLVGFVIIFGDVNDDGEIHGIDYNKIKGLINNAKNFEQVKWPEYQFAAIDLNHDSIFDWQDYEIMSAIQNGVAEASVINQNAYAVAKNNLKVESLLQTRQNYVNALSETLKSKFEWSEDNKYYIVKGIQSGTTVGSLGLPSECIITRTNEASEIIKLDSDDPIQSGDSVSILKTHNGLEITLLLGQVE